MSDPKAEPLLSPVIYLSYVHLTFSNKKSWLSEVCIFHHRTRQSTNSVLGSQKQFPTDLLTQAALQVIRDRQKKRAATGWRGTHQRGTTFTNLPHAASVGQF